MMQPNAARLKKIVPRNNSVDRGVKDLTEVSVDGAQRHGVCMCMLIDLGETVLKMAAFLFPQLEGDEEQRRFEDGKMRYLQNKAKRLADKERQQ